MLECIHLSIWSVHVALSGNALPVTGRLSLSCDMGFWVSQCEEIGCDSPLACALEVRSAMPPCKGGISAILAQCHMKARKHGCNIPSAILSRKEVVRYEGYLAKAGCCAHIEDLRKDPRARGRAPHVHSLCTCLGLSKHVRIA